MKKISWWTFSWKHGENCRRENPLRTLSRRWTHCLKKKARLISTSLVSQIEYVGFRQCAIAGHMLKEYLWEHRRQHIVCDPERWIPTWYSQNFFMIILQLVGEIGRAKRQNVWGFGGTWRRKKQRVNWCNHKQKQERETMKTNLEK